MAASLFSPLTLFCLSYQFFIWFNIWSKGSLCGEIYRKTLTFKLVQGNRTCTAWSSWQPQTMPFHHEDHIEKATELHTLESIRLQGHQWSIPFNNDILFKCAFQEKWLLHLSSNGLNALIFGYTVFLSGTGCLIKRELPRLILPTVR